MAAAKRRTGTQSVQRISAILREVAIHNHRGLSSTEVAEIVDLHYPTAHRLLRCLVNEGFLQKEPKTKCYLLGPMTYELGLTARQHLTVRAAWRPTLVDVAKMTGDSAFLIARSHLDTICLERVNGRFASERVTLAVGDRRPLGVGAASIAILSLLPDDEVASIVRSNTARYRKHEQVSGAELRALVQRAREQGYALRDGPVSGARALSVAYRNPRNAEEITAVSVSGMTRRFTPRRQREIARHLINEVRWTQS